MKNLFEPAPVSVNHFLLASHLGPGKVWANAFNKNDDFGKIFLGFSYEFCRSQGLINTLFNEANINLADALLPEWEKTVGIPDAAFIVIGNTKLVRRIQASVKFASYGGIQMEADYVNLAAKFGITGYILTGSEYGLVGTQKEVSHTFYFVIQGTAESDIDFPLEFPIVFSADTKIFLKNLFDLVAPANVQVNVLNEVELP